MIQTCGRNVDRMNRELQPHGTLEFPCAAYSESYSDQPEQVIPWHWHEELEMVYVKAGQMKIQIPGKTYFLEKGDCLAVNSNILHYGEALSMCELRSLVFRTALVTGSTDSVFSVKYLLPLISQTSFRGYLFKKEDNKTEHFIHAFEALAGDFPGHEFTVREHLSKLCYFLYLQFRNEILDGEKGHGPDDLRIREMLEYIHSSFTEDISLSDIAAAAGIGERECLRCFKRTIQLSPMQYLLKYRIMQGASLCLKQPSKSISEIAVSCGFESPSYFSKMFKRFYGCSPREYKKEN